MTNGNSTCPFCGEENVEMRGHLTDSGHSDGCEAADPYREPDMTYLYSENREASP